MKTSGHGESIFGLCNVHCTPIDHILFPQYCSLRALGYDLPMADEGEREPEFEAILDALDPNRDGFVTLQEYMAYMISKETDKVRPNIS